jgi:hypothetical protein
MQNFLPLAGQGECPKSLPRFSGGEGVYRTCLVCIVVIFLTLVFKIAQN